MAAGLERRFYRPARRTLGAADQLHEHVDISRSGELDGVVEPARRSEIDAAVAVALTRGDGRDDEIAAALASELGRLLRQHPHDRCADGAQPGNSYTQRFRH